MRHETQGSPTPAPDAARWVSSRENSENRATLTIWQISKEGGGGRGVESTPASDIPHIPPEVIYSGSNEDYGFATVKYVGWDKKGGGRKKKNTGQDGLRSEHRELLSATLPSLRGRIETTRVQTGDKFS